MKREVSIEVSARHVHLSREAQDRLFGKDYELKHRRELAGGAGFVSEEQIEIEGPKGVFPRVRIIGPCREETQVEVIADLPYISRIRIGHIEDRMQLILGHLQIPKHLILGCIEAQGAGIFCKSFAKMLTPRIYAL